jgi:gliding motility-associated-like protein
VCHDTVFYAVEIADTFQVSTPGAVFCTSRSSVNGDLFYKSLAPQPPVIDLVTIDTVTNHSIITWLPSVSPETAGYLVFFFDGTTYQLMDTVWGPQITTYHDMFNNPCNDILAYAIATIDTCGLVGTMSAMHNSILPEVLQKPCEGEHSVSWNHYQNMLPALGGYSVFFNENGGAYSHLGSFSSSTTSAIHTNLLMGNSYCYFVEGYDASNQKTSRSCIKCNTIAMPEPIEILYIKTATVQNNDHILVTLYADMNIPAQEYLLYRSDDGITFTLQAQIAPSTVTNELDYHDYSTLVHHQSYYYYAQAIDLCTKPALISDTAKTILLSVDQDRRKFLNHLHWNDYIGFDGQPTTFNVWRIINGQAETMPVATISPGTENYLDDAILIERCDEKTAYTIEAIEGPGNKYGLQGTSWSNTVSTDNDSRLFVPNAFTPDGIIAANTTFKPAGVCLSPDGYELMIFNRFGQLLFISHELDHGWDGRYKEQPVPEGVYTWKLSATTASGKQITRHGTVTLIW